MMTMTTMTPFDNAVDVPAQPAPVDDLLRIYLGQTAGGRVPVAACAQKVPDAHDLWDYLGDFA
jgi:hypothetical protein